MNHPSDDDEDDLEEEEDYEDEEDGDESVEVLHPQSVKTSADEQVAGKSKKQKVVDLEEEEDFEDEEDDEYGNSGCRVLRWDTQN